MMIKTNRIYKNTQMYYKTEKSEICKSLPFTYKKHNPIKNMR